MPDWNPFAGTAGVMRRPPTLADLLGGGAAAGVGGFADNPSGAAIPSGPQPVLHDEDFGPAGGGMMAPMAPPSGPVPKELFTPPPAAQTGFNMTTPTGSVLQNVAPPDKSEFGNTIDFLRGQNKAQGLDLFAQPIPAGDPGGPGAGGGFNPEAIARRAQDIGDSSFNMNMGGFGGIPGAAAGANELSKNFLGLMASQQKNQGGLDIAKEQSRGHIEAARLAAGGHDSAENRDIDKAIVAKKITPEMGQALKDEAAAKRGAASGAPAGPAPSGPAGSKTVSQVQQAESRTAALRGPFGGLDQNGHFVPGAAPKPGLMHDLADKIDAKEVPEVAAAIRRGDFGDKSSVVRALATAAGQNYLMDQGVPSVPQDPNNPDAPSGIPGKVDTGLFSLVRNPAGTMVGRMAQNFNKRTSGSPYTHIDIPGYGQAPFTTEDLHGLSAGASNLGTGDNQKRAAKGRLDKQSLLLSELLKDTAPPSR